MKFDPKYFEGEVRDGFYVQPMMKRAWAAQIEVLEEIDRLCTRHNIQYVAAYGTLLGAIRHKGFIPWDDDIDIAMRRKDYERFNYYARRELPEGWRVYDHRDEGFDRLFTRVMNEFSIRLDKEFLDRFHGCPYVVGIDIYPWDNIPDNREQTEDLVYTVTLLVSLALDWETCESEEDKRKMLKEAERRTGQKIILGKSMKSRLLDLADKISASYCGKETENVALIAEMWQRFDNKIPNKWFDKLIRVPFENITLPAVEDYDVMLRRNYGEDYNRAVINHDDHDYPFIRKQQDKLVEFLKEQGMELPKQFHIWARSIEKPMVSVIVPCHNVEPLIDRFLASLMCQTISVTNMEIICVEDASTDGTSDKLLEWEKKLSSVMMVIQCEQSCGAEMAESIGREYATSDYVVCMRADEQIGEAYFEKLLGAGNSAAMIKKIQELLSDAEYESARECMEELKSCGAAYDDMIAILDAGICEALGDRNGMFRAIREGLKCAYDNYELYTMLGYYYLDTNINQAYLCFQNALYYCHNEEDRRLILSDMEELQQTGQVEINGTAIVIVSYNSCYMMQKNLESIRETLPEGTYHIVVVDNASDDGVTEWLQKQNDMILIANAENKGFPAACNQGVAATKGTGAENDDIYLLNNDTRLAPNALFWLKMALYENDTVGAAGSYSNYAGNDQQIEVEFSLPKLYLDYGAKRNVPEEEPYEERVRLSGFSMLIRREAWDAAGGFDEAFSPGYFEDDDLAMKIMQSGYRLLLCKNSFIYHAGSQSFAKCEDIEEILVGNHSIFTNKYGFDILECAYPDREIISKIPFSREDEFNLLQFGSRLGADLKVIQGLFPKAHVIGIEPENALYKVAQRTNVVFPCVAALQEAIKQPVFQVLLINSADYGRITKEELQALTVMCRADCRILPEVKQPAGDAGTIAPEKIKLVIWDLDNTFWQGILSEGEVRPIAGREELLIGLSDCGIVNSLSSKNNREEAMEVLQKWGVDKWFVFPDINWQDKGKQIKRKLEAMGLRAENVLFLDDDIRNLEEVKYYNPGIMVGGEDVIPILTDYVSRADKTDKEHKRLGNYRILEEKNRVKEDFDSKEQFLFYSGIQVEISNDCMPELDRIAELAARTNQLNYTKNRESKESLAVLLSEQMIEKGCVKVKDRFGDYGIVGFYCFEKEKHKLRHFLFSCRVLGMGIEQYVYQMLGCPELEIVSPVAVKLITGATTPWIHRVNEEKAEAVEDTQRKTAEKLPEKSRDNRVKVLFKGPCDLSAIEPYLSGGNLVTEFNYVNDRGFITTGQNHSMHIWESAVYSKQQIEEILADVPFLIWGDFQTSLFTEEYHFICYSLLPDCHAGLYKNKKTEAYVSFGSRNFDLTAPENKEGYINGSIVNHAFPFTGEIIDRFAEDWEFVGATAKEDLIRNLDYMYKHVPGRPVFILFLGSEIEYEGYNEEFADHAVHHREINKAVKKYAADKERIRIIEMTDFIKSQEDYEDSINHFSRNVYYNLATAVCSCINEELTRFRSVPST